MEKVLSSFPKVVRVGPIDFRVEQVDRLLDYNNKDSIAGDSDPLISRIRVEKGLSDQRKFTTLWHEILHALLEQTGNSSASDKLEERICDALSNGIAQVLRDNPALREQ